MKRFISVILSVALLLTAVYMPAAAEATSGSSANAEGCAVILNSTEDYAVYKASESGEKNIVLKLKAGSSVFVTPTLNGSEGERVEVVAETDGLYAVGTFDFSEGDSLRFTTSSSAQIEKITDLGGETIYDKNDCVTSGSWNKTSSSWIDYDGSKAWYGGTAYWEVSGKTGNQEIFYYIPVKAVGSNLWNTVVSVIKVTGDKEETIKQLHMSQAPSTSGWVSVMDFVAEESETYRIKIEKGPGDIPGVSDTSRLCAIKLVNSSELMISECKMTMPQGSGMCNTTVYVEEGTQALATIVALGETTNININAGTSGKFELGNIDFAEGGSITISDVSNSKFKMLCAKPVNSIYLDTTTAEIRELAPSAVKGFNSAPGYYGNGGATWTIPSTVSGLAEIYYYIPDVSNGGSPCSAIITYTADDGTKIERVLNGANIKAGWHKLAVVNLSGSGEETLDASRYTAENYSTVIRVYGFKIVEVADSYKVYAFKPESFGVTGDWNVRSSSAQTYGKTMLESVGTMPAVSSLKLENGRYYVYVYDCDFKDYQTGSRNFSLKLNGTQYSRTVFYNFGTHQVPGTGTGSAENNTPVWAWEKIGFPRSYVDVTNGKLEVELKPNASYARAEVIIVTDNPFITTETVGDYVFAAETVEVPSVFEDEIPYPAYFKGEMTEVNSTITLSNDNTKVSFRQGTLESGNAAVQRKTVVGKTVTNTFESGLGFLSIRAEEAIKDQTQGYYASFNVGFNTEDGYQKIDSQNVYVCGKPEWLVPDTLEKLSDNSVKMTAENDNVKLTAVWTLEENDLEPKVDITAEIKNGGVYTFGFFNDVNEISEKEVGYILNPYRWQEKRLSQKGQLLRESSSTTAHTQMTYKMNDNGEEITLGVAVDESAIAKGRWTHDIAGYTRTDYYGNEFTIDYSEEQSNFAMGSIGHNGGVQPVVFAPILSTEDSVLSSGDTFSFSYRPLATVSDAGENRGWYDCYRHVAQDLRGVYDYRDNYYDSMTNTVFNLTRLAMDDFYSGWDENMVGHYNIEDTYWVTNANALAYLSNYLLTEDEDMLIRRTLPSMATMLTRGSSLLNSEWSYKSRTEGPINKELTTSNIATMGNTTYEGAYLMTRGMMPVFRDIAKSAYMNTGVEKAGINLKNASDALWYDYARGDSTLSTAKEQGDKYLERRAFYSADNYVSEETFVNTSFTPDIQSQLDMYEATGDERYKEGAVEAARRFLPLLRTDGVPEDKTATTVLDAEQLLNEAKIQNSSTWWYNGEGYRRGADMYISSETTDNGSVAITKKVKGPLEDALVPTAVEYPEWVTGRTGLGVEQFATCAGGNRNVYMSTWASDLLRAGYLSGDELIMDMARCAVVGRFENYPGYYIGGFNTVVGEYEYPYEGFDTTNLYFHHIPVLLASLQDFLFSNAYVKSEGKVDFPYTRAQGYAWFNNRMYGHEAGVIYDETNMWPWFKEGTITVSSKQIDWVAGRKQGRAAFVLTNAGDNDETVTVTLSEGMNVSNGAKALIYDKAGNKSYQTVSENQLTLTIPAKGILTFAVNGRGIKAPAYSNVEFDKNASTTLGNTAQGFMYTGKTYKKGNGTYSTDTGYDVKAYSLSLDPENYMAYVFVGARSTDEKGGDGDKGIVKTTLRWRYEGESKVNTVVDDYFPYEFFVPVSDRSKVVLFNVETEYKNGVVKTLPNEGRIAPADITLSEGITKDNFEPVSMSIINALGAVSSPLTNKTDGKSKYCIADADVADIHFDVSAKDALKGCYLSGYLKVKDNKSTTDVVERGYILFNNVPIVESVINTSKENRLDFSAANIAVTSDLEAAHEYADGVYVGEAQGYVTTKNSYEWDNLYITNASEKKGLQIEKKDSVYVISTDGAECLFVAVAKFEGGKMVSVSAEQVIVSVNNSKIITVTEGEKLFVWKCDVNKGTSMQPVPYNLFK